MLSPQKHHFHLLDILRGLASLSVVLWHYQHFFFIPGAGLPSNFDRTQQPFYDVFSLFYNEGSRAVQLFFVLSGFIFFYQYSHSIKERKTGVWKFFVLRFSRLYPLHFVTLIWVAVGQVASVRITGDFFVFHCNNWMRFVVSALFLTDWLPESRVCPTFNGPTWSLSVEVFLYVVFFIFCIVMSEKWRGQIIAVVTTIIFSVLFYYFDGYHLLGEPVACFFAGGLACLLLERTRENLLISLITFCGVASAASLIYMSYFGASRLLLALVTYPFAVFALAAFQKVRPNAGRPIRIIGDITYSTYLLHFPLQLTAVLILEELSIYVDFRTKLAWCAFILSVIAMSIVSFYFFERPMQRLLRYGPPRIKVITPPSPAI
jgi:peptidoglycan/LPS O-acetylase OafA/YrhL